MKEYELIIETTQPPCGGKPPRLYEFLEIETDDPIAYVTAREPGMPYSVHKGQKGEIVIEIDYDKHHVSYQFSEF